MAGCMKILKKKKSHDRLISKKKEMVTTNHKIFHLKKSGQIVSCNPLPYSIPPNDVYQPKILG